VIGIIKVGSQAMADRFTYVPHVGIFIVAAWGAVELAGETRRAMAAVAGAAGLTLVLLGAITAHQIRFWRDDLTLFTRAHELTVDNALVEFNLGVIMYGRGDLERALFHYREALRIEPNASDVHNNIGNTLLLQERVEEAANSYARAVQYDPDNGEAIANLGNMSFREGRLAEAEERYREALRKGYASAGLHTNLAVILEAGGRSDEALDHLEQSLRLIPDSPKGNYNMGSFHHKRGNLVEATRYYRRALHLDPAYRAAGVALATIERHSSASDRGE
jgi:tetratricopeptide (TPR) repeat protein